MAAKPNPGALAPSSLDPADYDERLTRALLTRAQRARKDPVAFFSFVMREEFSRARIQAAAHQRVFFAFVDSFQNCVVRMPPGFTKTYSMAALTMYLLGQDVTKRCAIISASREQAAKPTGLVRDYIENRNGQHPELRIVYPHLRPSPHEADAWTQTKLVIDRPSGIRDASVAAFGLESRSITGSRLAWILVDDILDNENTATPAGREGVINWFQQVVLSRMDARDAKIVVTNTPWHQDDLTGHLEKKGWPTLTMDAEGGIQITGRNTEDWDTPDIRPGKDGKLRLVVHDDERYGAKLAISLPSGEHIVANDTGDGTAKDTKRVKGPRVIFDAAEEVPLWPEKFDKAELQAIIDKLPSRTVYNRNYLMLTRSDDDRACSDSWIELCKANARRAGVHSLAKNYTGTNPTVTGVDLAFGDKETSAKTAFFTFELFVERMVLPGGFVILPGMRRILDVETGRWKGGEIVRKMIEKERVFRSIVRVESNVAQRALAEWALELDVAVNVREHFTGGGNKHHAIYGVESVFFAMERGAWLIPNDMQGNVHPMVQEWLDGCLDYRPPPAHTPDAVMASWFAAEQARELWGPIEKPKQEGGVEVFQPSLAASLLSR